MSALKIIEHPYEVEELIHHCYTTKAASIDYETSSFNFFNVGRGDYPLMISCSFQPGSSWVLPMGHKESPFKKTWPRLFRKFAKEVLENYLIAKIAWNLKFEYKWTLALGYKMKGILKDAMLAKYILDEERPHDLKDFAAKFYPQYAGYEDEMNPPGKKKLAWPDKPFLPMCKYCGIDSDITHRGMVIMEPKLIKHGFYPLFRNLLMMATRVLGEAEYRGILTDKSYLEDLMGIYKLKLEKSNDGILKDPKVFKFERAKKKDHVQKLIDKIELEIAGIEEEQPKNIDKLIANREAKLKRILEGDLRGKKEIYAGFNPNSTQQLVEFLFTHKRGLRIKPTNKTETGNWSTDEDTLLALKKKDKTGFIPKLLDHRALVKLDSTYISGVYPLLDINNYIHAGFKIHGTVTGRLSCSDPNLQNIPRDTTSSDIKKMFIPPPGFVLLEVDYGQAELRVVAELSGDKNLIEIFRKGYNVHVATACRINGGIEQYDKVKAIIKIGDNMSGEELAKPENKEILFWLKQKKRAKSLNFSILYGQGDEAMAEELECTENEARQFRDEWFDQFPGVKRWMKKIVKFCHTNGYVPNMFGRKRRLYDIHSDRYGLMKKAERDAVNSPIQGASSDFGLFSLVIIRGMILCGKLPVDMQLAYTVHDSLGYYVRPKDIHKVVPIISKICQNPQTQKYFGFELKHVAMKVSPEIGLESWGDLNEYHEDTNYVKLYRRRASL